MSIASADGNSSPSIETAQRSEAVANDARRRHFGPRSFLSREEIRELSQMNSQRLISALGFDFAIIAVAVAASEFIGKPVAYLIAVMTIGARLTGVGSVALHDGVHNLLLKRRVWNDRLGSFLSWLVFTPLLITFSDYRKSHLSHHRATNTDDDPDLILTESFYKGTRWKTVFAWILALTGVLFSFAVIRFVVRNWKTHPFETIIVAGLISAISFGIYSDVYPAKLAFWYWIVPVGTWGIFVNHLRTLAEHYPEDEYGRNSDAIPDVFRTRDILNSWFDSMFVVTRGVNFHLSHHLCPQVPFYNLPVLQQKLAQSPVYQNYAHVTHGYHRVLAEYFCAAHSS